MTLATVNSGAVNIDHTQSTEHVCPANVSATNQSVEITCHLDSFEPNFDNVYLQNINIYQVSFYEETAIMWNLQDI